MHEHVDYNFMELINYIKNSTANNSEQLSGKITIKIILLAVCKESQNNILIKY